MLKEKDRKCRLLTQGVAFQCVWIPYGISCPNGTNDEKSNQAWQVQQTTHVKNNWYDLHGGKKLKNGIFNVSV